MTRFPTIVVSFTVLALSGPAAATRETPLA
jgi:hypothetical protein